MSLTKPEQKMSKSDSNPKSRILITDSEEEISNKVKAALTDSLEGVSYDPNLLDVMFHMGDTSSASPHELAEDCKDLSMRALKERVAKTVIDGFRPIRDRYHEVFQRDSGRYLDSVAHEGADKASINAAATMHLVKDAVGL